MAFRLSLRILVPGRDFSDTKSKPADPLQILVIFILIYNTIYGNIRFFDLPDAI